MSVVAHNLREGVDVEHGGSSGNLAEEQARVTLTFDQCYVLFLMTILYAINIADRYIVTTLIEPIKKAFSLDDFAVGLLTGTSVAIFYVLASIPISILGDRYSRRNILVIAVFLWSGLTAICGIAQNFGQFFLARLGVGIGEAGGTPLSQSLLSDRFRPSHRGFVMTLFTLGAAAGSAVGAALGGYLVDTYDWRMPLKVFGLLGLPVAALVALTVREPARGRYDSRPATGRARFVDTLAFIGSQKAVIHLFAGASLATFWSWGIIWWLPSFLLRSWSMSLADSGRLLGLVHGVGGIAVTLVTAWMMARLRHDPRMQMRVVAGVMALGGMIGIFLFGFAPARSGPILLWAYLSSTYFFSGPSFAMAQNLAPANMRAQVCALILLCANVVNLIISPLLVGACSDLLAQHIADPGASLRYVLAVVALTGIWAAYHYLMMIRHLDAALEAAGTVDQADTCLDHGPRDAPVAGKRNGADRLGGLTDA
jgi:predicted MFS family arabinose efflux permease